MGAYLRAARRKRRVSIDRAAEQTRIRSDFLMRMESDEFDFLAPAYVRGFLKTYARFLRVDPEPLLQEFDRKYNPQRFETAQIVALERHGRQSTPERKRLSSSWSLAAVVAAVVLLTLGIVGLVNPDDEEPARSDTLVQEDEETPSPTPEPSATPSPEVTEPEDASVAFAEGVELEVLANGDCWVDITADGEVIFSETMHAGDTQTFTADKDMDVVLGFAEAVELTINGEDVGSPGVPDVFNFSLPEDFESLSS